MSTLRDRLNRALGFAPDQVEELPVGFVRTLVRLDEFTNVVNHWRSAKQAELPVLLGITPSVSEASRLLLNILLELPGEEKLLCLEVDVARDRQLPDLRSIWPGAEWWQEELSVFSGARFEGHRGKCADRKSGATMDGGTRWQQA